MKNIGKIVSFVLGAAVGSAVTFTIVSKKYQDMYEEDVASVKAELKKKYQADFVKSEEKSVEIKKPAPKKDKCADAMKRVAPAVMDYQTKVSEEGYTDYTKHEVNKNKPKPRIIPIREFGADADYDIVTLYWTADDVLVDDDGEPVENVPETVGGEAIVAIKELASQDEPDTDDCVYVINDERENYYEILITLKTSEEFN